MSETQAQVMSVPAEYSARRLLTTAQRWPIFAAIACITVCAIISWTTTASVLITIASGYFLLSTIDRAALTLRGMSGGTKTHVSAGQAYSIPDAELPSYTVLVPAYDEPEIMHTLIEGVGRIDYPPDKLDIFIVMEADDVATIAAFEAERVNGIVGIHVPSGLPRTKPKACNVAMESPLERSDYVAIFDADDIPDPLQLRRAAFTFAHSPDDVAAVQCRLGYYNERQNLLTKWFAMEYDQWFNFILPALSRTNCIIPLGGSSNHIRTSVLRDLGGWDAFNVTEDADLGIRLARNGFRTVILDSLTEEEANADVVNWLRQRSRWYKGYLQTFIVHVRNPLTLYREIGFIPFVRFANLTAGMPIANMLNIGFWALVLIWYAGRPAFIDELFPGLVYYLSLFLFIVGNICAVMLGLLSTRVTNKSHLLVAALLVPAYWFLQAIAAIKAVLQLIYKPSYWEKTMHGLTTDGMK